MKNKKNQIGSLFVSPNGLQQIGSDKLIKGIDQSGKQWIVKNEQIKNNILNEEDVLQSLIGIPLAIYFYLYFKNNL